MERLPEKLQKTFEFIQKCQQEGTSPTVREICSATGIKSTSSVHAQLQQLAEMGYIQKAEKFSRAIKVSGETFSKVPVLGRVTAGMPILAVEEIEGYVSISENVRRGRELFALRIVGDSMTGVGILDGDIVVVNKTPSAENGSIVVALIDEEATVKTFYKENRRFRLQPENPAYEPIIINKVEILGQVISLVRNYR